MSFDIYKKYWSSGDERTAPQIRVVFMGTPDFAAIILEKLLKEGYNLVAVYTKPDKARGRKQEIIFSPVKQWAIGKSLPLEQPETFDTIAEEKLRSYKPDIIIVAAYGKILPKSVLDIPGFGCINVHASLLPRWRGASPVQNALLAGDTDTGATLMLMDEGIDTGAILAKRTLPIRTDDTLADLLQALAILGGDLLLDQLPLWVTRAIEPAPQSETHATLCQLIDRADGKISWNNSGESIWNQYRALSPWPGIFTFWKIREGEFMRLKLTSISPEGGDAFTDKRSFGEVFERSGDIFIATGTFAIRLERIQPSGKGDMAIRDFINGHKEFVGSILQ